MSPSTPKRISSTAFRAATLVLLSAPLAAQSFNVDVGEVVHGQPSATYGAAANQPGHWNGIDASSAGTTFVLDDLSGTATAVQVTYTLGASGGGNFWTDNLLTFGDDELLMDDLMDVGISGSETTWTFENLTPGTTYDVYTYAWAPDVRTVFKSQVEVFGAVEPIQGLGGYAWPGQQQLGLSVARHFVTVPGDGKIALQVTPVAGFASLNGIQLVEWTTCTAPRVYCTAKANSLGCDAALSYAGLPSATDPDGFEVNFGPVPGFSLGILIYTTDGELSPPILGPFGYLCISANKLFRLGAQFSGGTSLTTCDGRYATDFNDHFATQTVDPNLLPGVQVNAQFWYRDLGVPQAANFSNAIEFTVCP